MIDRQTRDRAVDESNALTNSSVTGATAVAEGSPAGRIGRREGRVRHRSASGFLARAALLLCSAVLGAQGGVEEDRAALLALYESNGGASWKESANWSSTEPLAEWFGVEVDSQGRVTGLELGDNGLIGDIPSELGNLARLRRLDLPRNELSGPIPAELSRLTSLEWLNLSENRLSGSIPEVLGGLANLWVLDLAGNSLNGPIPAELGQIDLLSHLNLSGNALSGKIPTQLSSLGHLWNLDLSENRLTGSIPSEFRSLAELKNLQIANNDLGGAVPVELAHLANLESLYVYGNEVCAPRNAGFQFWLANLSFVGVNCPPDHASIVDVAVVYTQAARSYLGGPFGAQAEIDLMIAETNQAYAQGGMNLRISLAATQEVSYLGRDSNTDLDRLRDPADGHLDDVHKIRDAVGADIVVLILGTQSWTDASDVCGLATQLISGWLSSAFASRAFVVMKADCGSRTFAHELGHIMGVAHDRYEECDGGGCDPAAFPYGHGYVNQRAFESGAPASTRWRTVMSYEDQCRDAGFECVELLRFSNPLQTYAGDPMGVPGRSDSAEVSGPSDAVRTVNLTRELVSEFRPRSIQGPPVTISFGAETYTATEGGGAASVTVNLSAPAQGDLAIPLTLASVGGASFEDYSGVPLKVRFARGESASTFDVVASDDSDDDEGEQVVLGFGALPNGATANDPATAVVSLADNDLTTQSVALSSGEEILVSRNGSGPWMLDGEPAENGSEVIRGDQTHVLELADGQWRLARYAIRSVAGQTSVEDGIAATESTIFHPSSVVTDTAGNVYVADTLHHRIRMIDPSGLVSTVAGTGDWGFSGDGGLATAARLSHPYGLALDSEGNLYVSDSGNHRVRRIDSGSRTIETVAGTGEIGFSFDGGPAVAAQLASPQGLAADDAGTVYMAESSTSRVRRIDSVTGIIDTVAGTGDRGYSGDGGPATEAMLQHPFGVAVDMSGNLYVADTWNHRVRRVDASTGLIETLAGGSAQGDTGDGEAASEALLDTPMAVAVDEAGNVYMTDSSNHRIRKIDAVTMAIDTLAGTGERGYSGDGGAATDARLTAPRGITADGSGTVYVADTWNHRVRRVDHATGTITSVAGSGSPTFSWEGGDASRARLNAPASLALDGSGNVLFVDSNRVWKLDTSGMIEKLAGTGSFGDSGDGAAATEATLGHPQGIAVDMAGNVYIADTWSHRIRKIDAVTGVIETLAGTGDEGYSGDGGPAADAQLWQPEDVTLDAAGNVFVADSRNHRVRRIDGSTGIISTVGATASGSSPEDGGFASAPLLHGPTEVAVDGDGNVLVAERRNNRVMRIDPLDGSVETLLTVDRPEALRFDGAGNLLVGAGHRILSVGSEGKTSLIAGTGMGGFSGDGEPAAGAELSVSGIAVNSLGAIWFTDPISRRIRVLEPWDSRN